MFLSNRLLKTPMSTQEDSTSPLITTHPRLFFQKIKQMESSLRPTMTEHSVSKDSYSNYIPSKTTTKKDTAKKQSHKNKKIPLVSSFSLKSERPTAVQH